MTIEAEQIDVAGWIIPKALCPVLGKEAPPDHPFARRVYDLVTTGKARDIGQSPNAFALVNTEHLQPKGQSCPA